MSLEKKTFACAIFGKFCYVACAINRAGQFIYLRASLHERDVSLTSLHLEARFNKTIIVFVMELSHIKQVQIPFSIEETIVRSIKRCSKLRPSLSSRLFFDPRSRYITNQSGSTRETVSLKTDENIEILILFVWGRETGF